jgi:hypothetical protein
MFFGSVVSEFKNTVLYNPFSKINPGAIPGSISFMHGLKFAENLQFYQSDRQKLKPNEIVM